VVSQRQTWASPVSSLHNSILMHLGKFGRTGAGARSNGKTSCKRLLHRTTRCKEKFERLKKHDRKALYCPLSLLVNIIGRLPTRIVSYRTWFVPHTYYKISTESHNLPSRRIVNLGAIARDVGYLGPRQQQPLPSIRIVTALWSKGLIAS
jgi:hypothetical protein